MNPHPDTDTPLTNLASLTRGYRIALDMLHANLLTSEQAQYRIANIMERAREKSILAQLLRSVGELDASAPKRVRRREPDTKRILA